MSETARRIRILIQLYENNSISIDQLKNEYNSSDMINSRLERLLKMGEIKKDASGRYYSNHKIFSKIATGLSILRKFI